MRMVGLVMEAEFRTADVAGRQTGYAFDFARGVPGALSDDAEPARGEAPSATEPRARAGRPGRRPAAGESLSESGTGDLPGSVRC
jgi:hypothetical protein